MQCECVWGCFVDFFLPKKEERERERKHNSVHLKIPRNEHLKIPSHAFCFLVCAASHIYSDDYVSFFGSNAKLAAFKRVPFETINFQTCKCLWHDYQRSLSDRPISVFPNDFIFRINFKCAIKKRNIFPFCQYFIHFFLKRLTRCLITSLTTRRDVWHDRMICMFVAKRIFIHRMSKPNENLSK